jgi:hypothetical protein
MKSRATLAICLEQNLAGKLGRTANPEQVAGLPEICFGGRELGCFRVAETELAKLLQTPAENLVVNNR